MKRLSLIIFGLLLVVVACKQTAPSTNTDAGQLPAASEALKRPINDIPDKFEGMYNYMADAGIFTDCSNGVTYAVAQTAANAELENQYLKQRAGDNAKVWIEVKGAIIEQTGMEGDATEKALRVDKVIAIDKNKVCEANARHSLLLANSWQLIEVLQPGLPGSTDFGQAVMTFGRDGKVSGSNGCNRFNGSYESKAGSLDFGPLMTTRRACPGELGKLAFVFDQLMAKINGYVVSDGILRLLVDEVPVLHFAAKVDQSITLRGKWRVKNIADLAVPDDINLGEVAYLDFLADLKLAGKTGCNQLSSSYSLDGSHLKFGISASTMMACPPDFMAIETAIQKAMAATTQFSIEGDLLSLIDHSGAEVARLERAR